MRAAIEIAGVALLAAPAAANPAKPDDAIERRTVVSVPVMSLSENAAAIQAEHPVARHLSVALAVGAADAADGDYTARSGSLGGELRVWLSPRQRWLFAGPRVEAQVIHASMPREGRSLGTWWTFTEGLVVGCRLVLFDHVEITPSGGIVAFHDLGADRVPAMTRVTFGYGLALGWVF